MKIVKISAIWCGGCLVMNKVWENIKRNYPSIEIISLDFDMDSEEVEKYNVGEILPVTIFYKNDNEVKRINGEVKEQVLIDVIEELK
ncbi:MAG: thioredoxin family protein [Firmicutes bacterium]|nr:thioredoxin family protein [Bacillota bacterium]